MNIKITLTNKMLFFTLTVSIFLLLIVGVLAYELDMSVGDPTVMGHSAGEIMINDSFGNLISLQNKIDSGIDFIEFNETWDASGANWMSTCSDVASYPDPSYSGVNLDGYNFCYLTHYEIVSSTSPYPVNCFVTCLK